MNSQQIFEQIELWIMQGRLTFDDLQILSGQAYAKEASDDNNG